MLFFALGTNMDIEHIRGWLPSARKLAIASLRGHEFRFHKRSPGGAKADAFRTDRADDVVWGVISKSATKTHGNWSASSGAQGTVPSRSA